MKLAKQKVETFFKEKGLNRLQKFSFYLGCMLANVDATEKALQEKKPDHHLHDPMVNYYTKKFEFSQLMRWIGRCKEDKENEPILSLCIDQLDPHDVEKSCKTMAGCDELRFYIFAGRSAQWFKQSGGERENAGLKPQGESAKINFTARIDPELVQEWKSKFEDGTMANELEKAMRFHLSIS